MTVRQLLLPARDMPHASFWRNELKARVFYGSVAEPGAPAAKSRGTVENREPCRSRCHRTSFFVCFAAFGGCSLTMSSAFKTEILFGGKQNLSVGHAVNWQGSTGGNAPAQEVVEPPPAPTGRLNKGRERSKKPRTEGRHCPAHRCDRPKLIGEGYAVAATAVWLMFASQTGLLDSAGHVFSHSEI